MTRGSSSKPAASSSSLAHLVFGALCEAAMMLARAENRDAARRAVRREVKDLLAAIASG